MTPQMRTTNEQNKSEIVRKYLARSPRSTAWEIIRAIKRETGLDVSPALVAKAKREATATPSAKSNGASKAEQIRQVAKSLGGKVRPRDVIARLAEQGVEVSSAQVSTVLASMGMKRRGRRGRRPAVVETVASTLTLESLMAAKKLVNQLGSLEAAKTAVDALAKLG